MFSHHAIFSLFLSTLFFLTSNIQFSYAVIGGEDVEPQEYPFMVYLSLCGGSLISPDQVLTVSSCVIDSLDIPVNGPVWMGRHGTINGTAFNVTDIQIHPTVPLAIWTISPLPDPAEFWPITLDGGDRFNHIDEVSRVIGWGFEFYDDEADLEGYSYDLSYIDVPIISDDICEPVLSAVEESENPIVLEDAEICAGAPGLDCCSGDEGGPMFFPFSGNDVLGQAPVQHAVVSWHPGVCGDPFGVYINLAGEGISDWISTVAPEADWNMCDNKGEIPVLLDDPYSYMVDEVLSLVIAVPRDTDWFETVFDYPYPGVFGNLCQLDSTDIDGSPCWERIYAEDIGVEDMYSDHCWWLHRVTVSLFDLYASHAVKHSLQDGFQAFYSHLAITTHCAQSDPITDGRGVELPDISITSSHKFSILFPERVTVTGDIRVYDDVNLYFGYFEQSHWDTHWDWGFDDDMEKFDAIIGMFTQVQWPFRFSNPTLMSTLTYSEIEIHMSQDCPDPGIGEIGDEQYQLSINAATGLPYPCEQSYNIDIHPNANWDGIGEKECTLAGTYTVHLDVECQPDYEEDCPLDERFDEGIAKLEFDLVSENWCEWLDAGYHVRGELTAHSDATRDIESEQYDFIVDFVSKNDGQLKPRYIYFQARLYSDDTTIIAAELANIWLHSTDGKEYQLMTGGADTSRPDLDFVHRNYAIPDVAYAPADRYTTCNFEFCLPYHIFPVRHRDSEPISIWATVDVWISDAVRTDKHSSFTRPSNTLLENDPTVRKITKRIELLNSLKTMIDETQELKVDVNLHSAKEFDDKLPEVDEIREVQNEINPKIDTENNGENQGEDTPENEQLDTKPIIERSSVQSKSIFMALFMTIFAYVMW